MEQEAMQAKAGINLNENLKALHEALLPAARWQASKLRIGWQEADYIGDLLLDIKTWLTRWNPEKCKFKTFAYHNLRWKLYKIYAANVETESEEALVNLAVYDSDNKTFLDEVLATLSESDREFIELFIDGKKAVEVAELLGVTKQAVSKRRQIIFEKLRKKITQN